MEDCCELSGGDRSAQWALCRRFWGLTSAVIASVLYSCASVFILSGVQGLREDTIFSTFVIFIWCCMNTWERKPDWIGCLWLGLSASLVPLIRMNSLFLTLG